MRKLLIAVFTSIILFCAASNAFAEPEAEQNRETGNIEINGINDHSVTVQILKPSYKEGSVPEKDDIANILLLENDGGTVTVPVNIDVDGIYTVKTNGKSADSLWQTKLYCYNIKTIAAVINIISNGTDDEIYRMLEDAANREKLGIDEKSYGAVTEIGKRQWVKKLKDSEIKNISDYQKVYKESFGYYAVVYAKSGSDAASAVDRFWDDLCLDDIMGSDDYKEFNSVEKTQVGDIMITAVDADKEKFEKKFSEAVCLTVLRNINGGADVNPVIKKYQTLLGSTANKYFSMNDTYSVDSVIAGMNFDSIEKCKNKIESVIAKSSGGGSYGGASGSSGGGSYGGTAKHIETTSDKPVTEDTLFEDLDSVPWAKEAILYLKKMNIAEGDGMNKFRPLDNITREEFIKLLTLAFDNIDANGEVPFSDIDKTAWYYRYVVNGYSKGLIKGITDDRFGIGENITRQDMVVLTYRYMTYSGLVLSSDGILTFDDKAQIGEYALEAVYALSGNGIIKGMEDGTFRPELNSNRAESALIIYNALQYAGRCR